MLRVYENVLRVLSSSPQSVTTCWADLTSCQSADRAMQQVAFIKGWHDVTCQVMMIYSSLSLSLSLLPLSLSLAPFFSLCLSVSLYLLYLSLSFSSQCLSLFRHLFSLCLCVSPYLSVSLFPPPHPPCPHSSSVRTPSPTLHKHRRLQTKCSKSTELGPPLKTPQCP